ncbi:MAG TPA: DUF3626 domain-containing protein [Pseudomonadota bacterium]|nr:DUF3626 domain-containing protein [Pseudomonadota bacterium]
MTRAEPPGSPQERAIAHLTTLAEGDPSDSCPLAPLQVTLHFHPDRLVGGLPILAAMARDGVYRSQFETGTSNGALSAYRGGERWLWESRIFGGAYDDAPAAERPKYGSLNFRGHPLGGSPRFGSAYLRLTGETLARTTFCYPDSVFAPRHFGSAARLSALLGAAQTRQADVLDDYIEAHVHGRIELARHVDALVLDPCYRDTPVAQAAARLGCPVQWHVGFRLSTDELRRHPDYRGPQYVELGLLLARDGYLDPGIIGDAARTGLYDEQALKRVWHYVARFGAGEQR